MKYLVIHDVHVNMFKMDYVKVLLQVLKYLSLEFHIGHSKYQYHEGIDFYELTDTILAKILQFLSIKCQRFVDMRKNSEIKKWRPNYFVVPFANLTGKQCSISPDNCKYCIPERGPGLTNLARFTCIRYLDFHGIIYLKEICSLMQSLNQ